MSNSLRPHGLLPTRFLCPWDSPGKNIESGCHFLLQKIFLTQGLNLCLLHWQAEPPGKPEIQSNMLNKIEVIFLSHIGSLEAGGYDGSVQ